MLCWGVQPTFPAELDVDVAILEPSSDWPLLLLRIGRHLFLRSDLKYGVLVHLLGKQLLQLCVVGLPAVPN